MSWIALALSFIVSTINLSIYHYECWCWVYISCSSENERIIIYSLSLITFISWVDLLFSTRYEYWLGKISRIRSFTLTYLRFCLQLKLKTESVRHSLLNMYATVGQHYSCLKSLKWCRSSVRVKRSRHNQ